MTRVASARVLPGLDLEAAHLRTCWATAVRAEWVKLRTVRGNGWLIVGATVPSIAVSSAAVAATNCAHGQVCNVDPGKLSLAGIQLGQAVIAVLAVLAFGGEYSTGMIRTTLAAVTSRPLLLAAKAVVVTGPVLCAAFVTVGGSVFAEHLLAGHGLAALSLADLSVWRAGLGSVLYLGLTGLLALGIGVAVRDAAAAIGLVLGLMYVFPLSAVFAANAQWQRRLEQIGPTTAGLQIQATRGLSCLPIGPWAGLGVLALWAFGSLLAGAVVLCRRDA